MFPCLDTNVLHMNFLTVDNVHSFDLLIEKCKSMHEMHLNNGEWNCTCPRYIEYATCKHKTSFKLNVLKEKVPVEYYMGRLLSRKKRSRPKKVPSALETVEIYDPDESDDDVDDDVCLVCPVCI